MPARHLNRQPACRINWLDFERLPTVYRTPQQFKLKRNAIYGATDGVVYPGGGMRQLVGLWAVWVIVMGAGCSPSVEKGYAIMFDGPVALYDTGVYHQGLRIGRILSTAKGPANTLQVNVAIDPDYQRLMATNAAFYASSGRLCYATLANYGQPLGDDGKWSGFRSKGALNWFKLKHLLANPCDAAARRAAGLAKMNR
jgi:hypothetical protein